MKFDSTKFALPLSQLFLQKIYLIMPKKNLLPSTKKILAFVKKKKRTSENCIGLGRRERVHKNEVDNSSGKPIDTFIFLLGQTNLYYYY